MTNKSCNNSSSNNIAGTSTNNGASSSTALLERLRNSSTPQNNPMLAFMQMLSMFANSQNVPTNVATEINPITTTVNSITANGTTLQDATKTLPNFSNGENNLQNVIASLQRENLEMKGQLEKMKVDDFYIKHFPQPYTRLDAAFLDARHDSVEDRQRLSAMADVWDEMRKRYRGDLDRFSEFYHQTSRRNYHAYLELPDLEERIEAFIQQFGTNEDYKPGRGKKRERERESFAYLEDEPAWKVLKGRPPTKH